MEYNWKYFEKFSFGVEWNYRSIAMLLFLVMLPNLLGMMNMGTIYGFKIHFFQIAIFIAALVYGPMGGMLSGLAGSAYSAYAMSNPYIVAGNMILGFFAGLFARYGLNTVLAVVLAYMMQLPWLLVTDYYIMHLPVAFITSLVIALATSNMVWAVAAHYTAKPIARILK
ncbi:hypothetical protein COV19_03700 [Candidatus Woesearchaeota archaeon CG10_big_fil_rev_8_21_14_0_10_44_13]|nr:MAG: hypothetical protein COV19_03700 [Candidatus Woesearchaeota archaeon CG10_big_fil_rev_8_21_14_0_10_44_13]